MTWTIWRRERQRRTNPHLLWGTLTKQVLVGGGLALALVLLTVACEPRSAGSSLHSALSTPNLSLIHNVTPNAAEPLFASIFFTPSTTYEQAAAILGRAPLAWFCDGVPSRVSYQSEFAAGRAAFVTSHTLYISYPYWDLLKRIASSSLVVGISGFSPYPCP